MARLVIVKVVKEAILTLLLVAGATSQPFTEFVTTNSSENIVLPSSSPALTIITFSADTNTHVSFRVKFIHHHKPVGENFELGKQQEKNIIAVVNSNIPSRPRVVWNMLTNKTKILHWNIKHMSVWSEHPVTWQVFHNDPAFLNTLSTVPSASVTNTTLLSTSFSFYPSPIFLTLAFLCTLLALSTLVLSILQCHRCASARSEHGQAASSSDFETFKSTETLVNQQAYSSHTYGGRGSLHISENSLYGVI